MLKKGSRYENKAIKQQRIRGENERLKKLLVKQQSLFNKLNEDKLVLGNSYIKCCLSPAILINTTKRMMKMGKSSLARV